MNKFFAGENLEQVIEVAKSMSRDHEIHVIVIPKKLLKDKTDAEKQIIVLRTIIDAFETHN